MRNDDVFECLASNSIYGEMEKASGITNNGDSHAVVTLATIWLTECHLIGEGMPLVG